MSFWSGKRVLVTGHTGFKGSWLSLWLCELGAEVFGLALEPDTEPSLFEQLQLAERMDHRIGDIRDAVVLSERVKEVQPDVVFHLAAQPLVLASYDDPLETWDTNVMGTAHMLDALRQLDKLCAAVMITTDKVYENREWMHPYREDDRLGGHDPYSASKAACELVISSYRKSFFKDRPVQLASARAGNVIGGGDWAENRLLPDIIRALSVGKPVAVRNPHARRPWQHVLEPLSGYLRLAEHMVKRQHYVNAYNFGPEAADVKSVGDLVLGALAHWPGQWLDKSDPDARHEAGLLSLGIEQARSDLRYSPRWDFAQGLHKTVDWYRAVHEGEDPLVITRRQIAEFGAP
ncbi:CDP-glucose 4,6-dehydratase [Aliisedimentitalea scapharcae]|uniref:CDP-glucose 4,6-dehydratase n=1 Tax=Aliisedimentitalea scapharcae TaxID=1524259 RepID=A0ABZ2XMD5_9RHOB|nr:CDP-glucose 4,6-dehydratase [Rhodobacteraceae bacterium M382]